MTETFAVVFQMGKVASTALTEALDSLPDVTAVQSHFLGISAMTKILQSAIDPSTSDYFFKHQRGQLNQNIGYTRTINCIQRGTDPRNLVILSLARNPFRWFQSSLVQDIEGFGDMLQALAPEGAGPDPEERLRLGLTAFLGMAADVLESHETVDECLAALVSRTSASAEAIASWPHLQRQCLLSAMRPNDWFQQHFQGALGIGIKDLERDGHVWRHEVGRTRYAVIRYEDIDDAFAPFCDWAFGQVPTLGVRNASEAKPMSTTIREAFDTPEAQRLEQALLRSEYARLFNYA